MRCGERFDGSKVADRNQIKCPNCNFKVIKKCRNPIVRRHKAE